MQVAYRVVAVGTIVRKVDGDFYGMFGSEVSRDFGGSDAAVKFVVSRMFNRQWEEVGLGNQVEGHVCFAFHDSNHTYHLVFDVNEFVDFKNDVKKEIKRFAKQVYKEQ